MTKAASSPEDVIVVINAGSGTIDATAFVVETHPPPGSERATLTSIWQLDVVRHTEPQQITVTANGSTVEYEATSGDLSGALTPGLQLMWAGPTSVIDQPDRVKVVGNRIVHGGLRTEPAELTTDLRAELEQFSAFAPIHNPTGLQAAQIAQSMFPSARHVAAFDTSFHTTIPPEATAFGGPIGWIERGIRRYGFHGISHRDAAHRTASLLGRQLEELEMITIHLGGGCSATAVRHGHSVDTTMGLTPMEGMVMATRSGPVDPGALIHLMRTDDISVDRLESMLNHHSGLMGLTGGRTGDIGVVNQLAAEGDNEAHFARDVYVRSVVKAAAGLRPSLQRLDAVVFTGGAVEQAPWLRDDIAEHLAHLGVDIDFANNDSAVGRFDAVDVSAPGTDVHAVVIEAAENAAIARDLADNIRFDASAVSQ